jgi:L-iditol 2-dehydrogenase
MKAVLIDSAGGLKIVEMERPRPREGEVLVKLRCCGICGTDLEKVHGEGITSGIVGHEEVGEIAELGPGARDLTVGERVFAHHHVGCGECRLCRKGKSTLCAEYSRHNLVPCGLAEYFIVPKYNVDRGAVLRLPDSLGFEEASFIEPLACCIMGLEQAEARGAASAMIYGAGPVGLTHLKLLRSYGVGTVGIADVSEHRISLARQMGARITFNPAKEGDRERALAAFDGGPELVVLATGSSTAFEEALTTVARGGTVLLFGVPRKGATARMELDRFFLKSARLVTSYAASERETSAALALLAERRIEVSDMITHRFPLERTPEAFEAASQQQCMKALITN